VLMVYANYDLTFPREYSLKVVDAFGRSGVRHEVRVLPCGHYTTGETPFKFIDAWHMGWFVYRAFKALREEKAAGTHGDADPVEEVRNQRADREIAEVCKLLESGGIGLGSASLNRPYGFRLSALDHGLERNSALWKR